MQTRAPGGDPETGGRSKDEICGKNVEETNIFKLCTRVASKLVHYSGGLLVLGQVSQRIAPRTRRKGSVDMRPEYAWVS